MVKLGRRDTQSGSYKTIRNTKVSGIQEAEAEDPVQSGCGTERKQKALNQNEDQAA